MIATFDTAWQSIESQLQPNDRRSATTLRNLVENSTNPLALVISGRLEASAVTDEDARALEMELLQQFESGATAREISIYLLCLFRLVRTFTGAGMSLPETRIALPHVSTPSPFCDENMDRAESADLWRRRLIQWSVRPKAPDASELAAACTLSAALFGALLDTNLLRTWMNQLHQALPVAGNMAFVEFHKTFRGQEEGFLRRWFPDPCTEALFARIPSRARPYFSNPKQMMKAIRCLLTEAGVAEIDLPDSLAGITQCAAAFWIRYGSQADVRYAQGKVRSHSLHPTTWRRLMRCAPIDVHDQMAGHHLHSEDEIEHRATDITILDSPWFSQIVLKLGPKVPGEDAIQLLQSELPQAPDESARHCYLGWLKAMLTSKAASAKTIKPSTAYRYFHSITSQMLALIGEIAPQNKPFEDLVAIYRLILEGVDPEGRKETAKGLREFQHYLHHQYGLAGYKELETTLGDDAMLSSVDANMVTEEDYRATLAWLARQAVNPSYRPYVERAQIALMLLYRTGCRRREILLLRLCDTHVHGQVELLIRPHEERTLKSESSTRKLCIAAFLTSAERAAVKDFYMHRLEACGADRQAMNFLFSLPEETLPPEITISNLVIAGLREVTGDQRLHLHILRHSHWTLTELSLRAVEFPDALTPYRHFADMGEVSLKLTYKRLTNGKRYRAVLIGADKGPTRTFGYACAQGLGHSSPIVSWEHYLHHSDLILYGMTCASLYYLNGAQYATLSGLPRSTISETRFFKQKDYLVEAVRRRYPSRFKILPRIQTPKGKPGRPKNSRNWIPLDLIRSVLDNWISGNRDQEALAAALAIPEEIIERIIDAANRWLPAAGFVSSGGQLVLPPLPQGDGERSYRSWLERNIENLARMDPDRVVRAFNIYLSRYQKKEKDVVFRNKGDVSDAKFYLKFLKSLGFRSCDIRLVVRGKLDSAIHFAQWKKLLCLADDVTAKSISPPNKSDAYGRWIGLHLHDPQSGDARLLVTTSTVVLAMICLDACSPQIASGSKINKISSMPWRRASENTRRYRYRL